MQSFGGSPCLQCLFDSILGYSIRNVFSNIWKFSRADDHSSAITNKQTPIGNMQTATYAILTLRQLKYAEELFTSEASCLVIILRYTRSTTTGNINQDPSHSISKLEKSTNNCSLICCVFSVLRAMQADNQIVRSTRWKTRTFLTVTSKRGNSYKVK